MIEDSTSEYISALCDQEYSDLTPVELEHLQHLVHERPECLRELRQFQETKLFLRNRVTATRCPQATSDSIRAYISHIYGSWRAAL